MDQERLTVDQYVGLLRAGSAPHDMSADEIRSEIEYQIERGAPVNDDQTINFTRMAAWLLRDG